MTPAAARTAFAVKDDDLVRAALGTREHLSTMRLTRFATLPLSSRGQEPCARVQPCASDRIHEIMPLMQLVRLLQPTLLAAVEIFGAWVREFLRKSQADPFRGRSSLSQALGVQSCAANPGRVYSRTQADIFRYSSDRGPDDINGNIEPGAPKRDLPNTRSTLFRSIEDSVPCGTKGYRISKS
jgi:hypothetical protein